MSDDRKFFGGMYDGEVPIFQATCSEAILPGAAGKAFLRDIEYGESDAEVDVTDLHNQNCILPEEKFCVYYDDEAGKLCPVGSTGLTRKVRASVTADKCDVFNATILTESRDPDVSEPGCNLIIESSTISVLAATRGFDNDEEFWVTYQADWDKGADNSPDPQPAASGRWVPLNPNRKIDIGAPGWIKVEMDNAVNTNYTVQLAQGDDASDAENIDAIEVSVGQTDLKKGGTYIVSIPWQLIIKEGVYTNAFNITDDSSNVQPFGFMEEGSLKIELYLYDTGAAITAGRKLFHHDVPAVKRFWNNTANLGYGSNFIGVGEHTGVITATFGIDQATIDALTGQKGRLAIYLTWASGLASGHTADFRVHDNWGLITDEAYAQSFILWFNEPEFATIEKISVTPAVPPP